MDDGRTTGTRVTARGIVWEAQLDLRRRGQEMRRRVPHTTGTPADCQLCKTLDALRDAERELDAYRKELP